MTSTQQPQRNCVSCGRTIDWNANICPYCGHDYRSQAHVAHPQKKDHTTLLIIVIVAIVVVVVVVLPLLLYIMILGFGGTSSTPGIAVVDKASIPGGFRIAFTAPTEDVPWDDVTFELSDADSTISYRPTTSALTSGTPPATQANPSGARSLGPLNVWINATDIAGNGMMNNGDYVTLQCTGTGQFSPSVDYTLVLIYEPTAGSMIVYVFTGFESAATTPGITVTSKTSSGSGFKIAFSSPTSEVAWTDLTIQLSDGTNTKSWNTFTTADLTTASPPGVWHAPQPLQLGSINVYLNITDLAGNGRMSNGDYITLQTPSATPFLSSVTYTLVLLYEPTSGSMISYTFTG